MLFVHFGQKVCALEIETKNKTRSEVASGVAQGYYMRNLTGESVANLLSRRFNIISNTSNLKLKNRSRAPSNMSEILTKRGLSGREAGTKTQFAKVREVVSVSCEAQCRLQVGLSTF